MHSNHDFNFPEFEGIKNETGFNRLTLSVKKWIQKTNAVGIIAQTGRYGGTIRLRCAKNIKIIFKK